MFQWLLGIPIAVGDMSGDRGVHEPLGDFSIA
jgi:hypothetical protein